MVDKDGSFTYSNVVMVDKRLNSPVMIFPNPAHDEVHVTGKDIVQVQVLNELGQIFILKSVTSADDITLDVSKLAKGLYLLQVMDVKGRVENRKLIKE